MLKVNPGKITITLSLLALSLLRTRYAPSGLLAYIVPALSWSAISLMAIRFSGNLSRTLSPRNIKITRMAFLVAVFQIFINLDAGLILKFGRSPIAFTPETVLLNTMMVASGLLGFELSRALLLRSLRRTYSPLLLVSMTLFFTFLDTSFTGLLSFKDRLMLVQYLGETFLPALAEQLLATYVALLGGPLASLAYRAPYQLYLWLCPILPDLTWGYTSLIGVMVPTIGFMTLSASTRSHDYRRAGYVMPRREPRSRRDGRSSNLMMALSIITVVSVWSACGLLGFEPRVVVSGSMRPELEVGDLAITVEADASTIREGDIIQYQIGAATYLHRVTRVYVKDGVRHFVTKGDANPVEDDPLTASQITGRMILSIPSVGWLPIHIKNGVSTMLAIAQGLGSLKLLAVVPVTYLAIRTVGRRKSPRWGGRA